MSQSPGDTWGKYRTEAPIVSVWLGVFPTSEAYREYFALRSAAGATTSETCRFWDDLGVVWTDPDNEEGSGYVAQPVPVAELLGRPFSYLDSFRSAVLTACQAAGIERANSVLFLYGYEYPAAAGFRSPYMTYVGAFPYRTQAEPIAAPDPARR